MEEKNPIQVSERIFRTIECLGEHGSMGLLDLSKELSLNKTTIHRILNSLICMDYVKQDPETLKYSLTFKICNISNQILSKNSMTDIARPHLKTLAEQTGEIVHLVQLNGTDAVYIDKVDATKNAVRLVSMVGKTIPLYCSGVGKALMADMSDEKITSIWKNSKIKKLTDYTIVELSELLTRIRQIRQKGYSLDNEENELGVRCIAVSLKNYNGKSNYAISISAPKDRMSDERIRQLSDLILQTKENIQHELYIS